MPRRLDFSVVKQFIESQGYTVLQNSMKNNKEKIKMQCDKGHIIEMTWGNFKSNGRRCRYCNIERIKTPIEEIKSTIESEGYTFIEEVEGKHGRRVKVKCPKNHIYDVTFSKFKIGRRCPICSDTTFSYDYVNEYIKKEGYILINDNYENIYQKLDMLCPKGHKYKTNFHNFKNNKRRCPRCMSYKGEDKIAEVLNSMNLEFIHQHRIPECKNINPLPFDFYIPNKNILIEYDGEQHFELKHAFSKEGFYATQKNDKIKDKFCLDNNIKLIRIPYWEFDNIEKILDRELK